MIFLLPYRLTYDFSILAKNYHTKSTGATICYIGYPTIKTGELAAAVYSCVPNQKTMEG